VIIENQDKNLQIREDFSYFLWF